MDSRGITLIELMVVIAIIGILAAVGTVKFSDYTIKTAIESQTRKMFSDLMEQRSRSLFEKQNRAIRLTASTYSLYSTSSMTQPFSVVTLKYPIVWSNSNADIIFDTQGMLQNISNNSICAQTSSIASVDSLVISETRIKLGKLTQGANCAEANITAN